MGRYWLDASVFIHASRNLWAFDINASFWAWLDGELRNGTIVSPKCVYEEVTENLRHQDDLARWVRTRKGHGLYIKPDGKVQANLNQIADYIFSGRYPQEEAWEFSDGADAWVIAHAMADRGTVVTNESTKHPEAKKVRIPDVCDALGTECKDIIGMIRAFSVKI